MKWKLVYFFGEGGAKNKLLLGNKGAQLGEMTRIGLPVPPGFTLSSKVCMDFIKSGKYPGGLQKEIENNIKKLEEKTGKKFGDEERPLLISIRSGASVSMPGMMDTVLNLGMNDKTVESLAKKSGNQRFAWDSYRRLVQMFGNVVLGIAHEKFEEILNKYKRDRKDTDLSVEELKKIVLEYKNLLKAERKKFPEEPKEQLRLAINAVFKSWNTKRAVAYRRLHKIPDDIGTAVNIQAMVFGNMDNNSGTGVGFTRNPSTGERERYGEYLLNAQGEDVVAGLRTPHRIDDLKKDIPEAYNELVKVYDILERHYRDMQDFEFTIESGKLYILQTRTGKRTAQAAIKIAVDMVEEGLIEKDEAILRIDPGQLSNLLHRRINPKEKPEVIAKGLSASPGAAVGKVVFTPDDAVEVSKDDRVILIRKETSPEDIHGMAAAQGILTSTGGMTSHAAIVARGMGKPCVAGCGDISIDYKEKKFTSGETKVKEGDWITLDGRTGEVMLGKAKTIEPEITGEFEKFMKWVDEKRTLKIKTNADTPKDAQTARNFGAEGIGLCRTEHMFFKEERIRAMREMILADSESKRKRALEKLLPYQKEDFKGLFRVMNGLPIIIRLLDPPLHEFLPKEEKEMRELAEEMNVTFENVKQTIESLAEFNPMLGFRGCRLGIKYHEINEMQVKAIFQAAVEVKKEGIKPIPQIEVPLVGSVKEFRLLRKIIDDIAKELGVKNKIKYQVGTMIEVPRAALTADEIAKEADFMSFGTNDLTQMACGFSRDDAGKFLKDYVEKGIYSEDPFQTIDQDGVGILMELCVKKARKTNPRIEIGICGEHGGDPKSIEFCHKIGLNDVSCSPFRVPTARLAAAQAKIKYG